MLLLWRGRRPIGFFDDKREGRRIGLELYAALGEAFGDDPNRLRCARLGLTFVYSR